MIEFKVAIRYGDGSDTAAVTIGEGLLGYAVEHSEVVLVQRRRRRTRATSTRSPTRSSELVVPLLVKDRCIGAFDLESPELNAFSKRHVELLTLLASQAAVAIENARLWESGPRQRGADRARSCASPSASRWRCCRRSCPSGSAPWTSPGSSSRPASWAATSTISWPLSPIS